MDKKMQMGLLIIITFVLAVCIKNDFIRFIFGFEVLTLVAALIELAYLKGKVTATLSLPETMVYRNEHFPVKVLIKSESRIPMPSIKADVVVKDLWANKEIIAGGKCMMDANEAGELVLSFDPAYCGAYAITLRRIIYWDHLGLFHRVEKVNDHTRTIYILPEVAEKKYMGENVGNDELEGDNENFRIGKSEVDTADIRAYREGDLLRLIHWKLSAKTDELMVREIGEPTEKMNRLYLNLQYEDESFEGGFGRKNWDEFLGTVARTSRMMLNADRAHYVCWIDTEIRKIIEYKVTDNANMQEMLCGLFHAKPWRKGEAVDILEDIRWDETREESIEINLKSEIILAGE